jgi:site-specific DNA recombinase
MIQNNPMHNNPIPETVDGGKDHPAKRVAFYARVSSEQQSAAGTIDSQVAALKERIAQDGWKLEEKMGFSDNGVSGSTLARPALERLRDAASFGVIDRLYVTCPDRLSRKLSLQMLLMEELKGYGVDLVFLNRAIGQTPEDDLLLQVQGVVAEYERAKILERSRRGKLHAARCGSVSALSKAPYGYRYVGKSAARRDLPAGAAAFNVCLEEAEAVRQMFHWVGVERLSLREVCRRLDKQDIRPAKGGGHWNARSLWGMLRNPAYKGSAAYGKRCSGPMRPRLRPPRGAAEQPRRPRGWYAMGPEKWIPIPVPAIVAAELFDAVAEQLDENQRRLRVSRRGARFLLQGLLVCACCGRAYCGQSSVYKYRRVADRGNGPNPVAGPDTAGGERPQPVIHSYYACTSGHVESGRTEVGCHNRSLRMEWLDEAVWGDVKSLLEEPGRIRREFERRLAGNGSETSPQRQRAATEAATLQRKMSRLIDAFQDELLDKNQFEPRMTAMRSRLASLKAEVESEAAAEAAIREMRLVIDRLETFAERIRSDLAAADWATRRDLIRTLVKRVEIEKEQVRLIYKVDILPFDLAPGPKRGLGQDCVLRPGAARATEFPFSQITPPQRELAFCAAPRCAKSAPIAQRHG